MTTILDHHDHPAPAAAGRALPRWPLFLIGSPAAVAVWSGWVGLGGLCGFGVIHPLPGIWDGLHLDTAITLPIGVEAYGVYALGAWLTPGTAEPARRFARGSAIGALLLGMAGQVIYHLLAAAHAARAPWPVVMLVSCMPVVALGFGAALTHLLRVGGPIQESPDAGERTDADADADKRTDPDADERTDPDEDAGGRADDREAGGPHPRGEVDRAAVVARLAGQIRDAIEAGERWQPDYPALMARTGFRRSWCEKAVRDARTAVFRTAVRAPARTGSPDAAACTGCAPGPDELARTGRPALHTVEGTGT